MKALVTGASGFLGSHIVAALLERGDSVRALVRPASDTSYLRQRGVELAVGDITEPATLDPAMEGTDVVYHAAALVTDWAPWPAFRRTTIDGTRNVLEAAARAGVGRLLHVSTDGVYALSALDGNVGEDSPLERRFGWWDYYRRSKLAAERFACRYRGGGPPAVTVVRPGLLLGERDRAVLPGLMSFLRSGAAAYLGHGRNRLPCVYAGDVAEACVLAATAEGAAGEAYNVAGEERVTQRDFFAAVTAETGLPAPRRTLPVRVAYPLALAMEVASLLTGRRWRPAMTRFAINLVALDYQEDVSKAKRELGWQARVPMREAVRRSVAWLREHHPGTTGG